MEASTQNGLSTKDLVLRLDVKFDKFMEDQAERDAALRKTVTDLVRQVAVHEADSHPETVKRLEGESLIRKGERRAMTFLFGTSVSGLLFGGAGLVLTLMKAMKE